MQIDTTYDNTSLWSRVLKIALQYPEVLESTAYGSPAIRVGKTYLAGLRNEGELSISLPDFEREILLETQPDIYYITDHYLNSHYVIVRLAKIPDEDLQYLIESAWRRRAPKRLVKHYDERLKSAL